MRTVIKKLQNLKTLDYVLIAIFCLYILKIVITVININYENIFGYLDHQSHWESVNDLLRGKLLYKDFFWEYGFLTLLIRIPFSLLLGRTFFASVMSDFVFLPIIGVCMSYVIARQIFTKRGTILFMGLLLLFGTNNDLNAIRHVIPELGLLLTILGLEQKNRKKIIIGSGVLALSLLSSIEYTVIAHASIVIYIVIKLLRKKITLQAITPFVLNEIIIGGLFLSYLLITNTLHDFYQFHTSYASSFFTIGPCGDVFPRWYGIGEVMRGTLPLSKYLMSINYYVIPVFLAGLTIWLLTRQNMKYKSLMLTLAIFSIGVFTRTVASPCYLNYGLLFPLLILSYFIFDTTIHKTSRIMLIIVGGWLILSALPSYISNHKMVPKENPIEKIYVEKAGVSFSKPIGDAYNETTEYIKRHSTQNDYIFVYPHGPFYELSERRNATDLMSIYYYQVAPYLQKKAYQQLMERKPPVIIINRRNAPNYLDSVRGISYNIHAQGNAIIFDGLTTEVEQYISEWYDLDKTNDVAWMLKRRSEPKKEIPFFIPRAQTMPWQQQVQGLQQEQSSDPIAHQYAVTSSQPALLFMSKDLVDANLVRIPVKVDRGTVDSLKKFGLFYILVTSDGRFLVLGSTMIDSNWQTHWIYLPKKGSMPEGVSIAGVMIKVSDNEGFLPGGKPQKIYIKSPQLYEENPQMDINASAFQN